jgi:hypothetical protein
MATGISCILEPDRDNACEGRHKKTQNSKIKMQSCGKVDLIVLSFRFANRFLCASVFILGKWLRQVTGKGNKDDRD